jgi:hypothetical protein
MPFKNFIVQERAYFSDLSTFSEEIIFQLTEKIKNKKNIRSGDSFIVELGDMHDIEIKFYKDYSRRARAFIKENPEVEEGVQALYFDNTTDKADGTIEIYLNHAKTYYYKDVDSIAIVNSRLPKFIKEILRHEITHAYESNIMGFNTFRYPDSTADVDETIKSPKRKRREQKPTYDEYVNSDEEVNAKFNELISSVIHGDNLVKYYISVGDNNAAMRALVMKIKYNPSILDLSDENKKWILKTAYTTIQDEIDKTFIEP